MDCLFRHNKYIWKLIVTCNWNHPGWPFLTIKFFKKKKNIFFLNGHIIDYENQYNSKCAFLRVLSLQVQQSRGKLLKVSFTEASMRTSDSKSTISYLFYTTYVLQSLQMLTNTQITSVHWTAGILVCFYLIPNNAVQCQIGHVKTG